MWRRNAERRVGFSVLERFMKITHSEDKPETEEPGYLQAGYEQVMNGGGTDPSLSMTFCVALALRTTVMFRKPCPYPKYKHIIKPSEDVGEPRMEYKTGTKEPNCIPNAWCNHMDKSGGKKK